MRAHTHSGWLTCVDGELQCAPDAAAAAVVVECINKALQTRRICILFCLLHLSCARDKLKLRHTCAVLQHAYSWH